MSMSANTESARYGCSIGFDLIAHVLDAGIRGVSVDCAEGCVSEVHFAIVDGFVLWICGHDWDLNGLFNRMITYKLYYLDEAVVIKISL